MKKVLLLLVLCSCGEFESREQSAERIRCERAGGEIVAIRRPTESPVDMRTYSVIEWICVVK